MQGVRQGRDKISLSCVVMPRLQLHPNCIYEKRCEIRRQPDVAWWKHPLIKECVIAHWIAFRAENLTLIQTEAGAVYIAATAGGALCATRSVGLAGVYRSGECRNERSANVENYMAETSGLIVVCPLQEVEPRSKPKGVADATDGRDSVPTERFMKHRTLFWEGRQRLVQRSREI